jgi:hypothetical protein
VVQTQQQGNSARALIGTASRPASVRSDLGLTLLEMMTSCVVLVVVLTAGWFLLTTTGFNLNMIQYGGQASEGNRTALASFQRDIDQSVCPGVGVSPIVFPAPRTVSIDSDVDNDGVAETVTWTTDDTQHLLLRVVTDGSTTTTTTVLEGLADQASDTMFTYATDAKSGWETAGSVATSTIGLVGMHIRNTLGPVATQTIVDRSIWCRVNSYVMNTLAQ